MDQQSFNDPLMDIPATLATHIRHLEEALLDPARRKSESFLHEVLADDFQEFGSSGTVYSKTSIIDQLTTESAHHSELRHFSASLLAEGVVLATYRTSTDAPSRESLRSSIWVFRSDRWQIAFHQGTKTSHSATATLGSVTD